MVPAYFSFHFLYFPVCHWILGIVFVIWPRSSTNLNSVEVDYLLLGFCLPAKELSQVLSPHPSEPVGPTCTRDPLPALLRRAAFKFSPRVVYVHSSPTICRNGGQATSHLKCWQAQLPNKIKACFLSYCCQRHHEWLIDWFKEIKTCHIFYKQRNCPCWSLGTWHTDSSFKCGSKYFSIQKSI